jgi:hypothetical protein
MLPETPMGPGWFMFFKNVKRGGPTDKPPTDRDRILKDDNELIEIITMVINCDGISGLLK